MVDLGGIGGREYSVGRLTACRSSFTASTLTALGLSQPEVVCTILKMQTLSLETRNKPRHTKTTPQKPRQSGDRDHLSRRHATKHVPHVNPCSPASIDPRLVEVGLVQIPQSITRRMLYVRRQIHRETDRQTDKLNNDTLYAPRYY